MSEGTTAIGQKDDAAVTDPALAASMIALLKGMLTQLGGTGGTVVDIRETGGNALVADDAAAGTTTPVPVGGIYNTAFPTYTAGDRAQMQLDVNGNVRSRLVGTAFAGADGTSNNLAGVTVTNSQTDGRLQGLAQFVLNGSTWDRDVKANAASRIASAAASVNATSAKGSAGNVFKVFGNNVKASVVYLKIYNKATAPTVGTDVPVLTIPIPASAPFNIEIAAGGKPFYLGTGIAYGFTTDAADNGTTALAAGDILGFTLTYA